MFFITYTVACLILNRITQVGNYLTTTEWGWVWCEGFYLCNQGECYPPRQKIKVDNSLPYLIILCIIQKLNSMIIVLVFIQNVSTFLTTLHPYRLSSKHLSVSHMVWGFNQILLSCRYSSNSKSWWHLSSIFGGGYSCISSMQF